MYDTTLELKGYYIECILAPYFKDAPIDKIDAKAIIDQENHLLESRTQRDTSYAATYLNIP